MRLFLLTVAGLLLLSEPTRADEAFGNWLAAFRTAAAEQGISPDALRVLDGIEPNPRVVELDQSQPERKISFVEYRGNILSETRIRRGRELYAEHKHELRRVTARYGVPGRYVVALWGIESSYGALPGKLSVFPSLATLAYEGRRAEFFRKELLAALKILDQDGIDPELMRGSWAGAMGQCQFMPSTFLNYAVDGDGDGERDIWTNESDVFASMANYLRAEGWQAGRGWGFPVKLIRPIAPALVSLKQGHTLKQWQKLGVRRANGKSLAGPDSAFYYLMQPDGAAGPSFLVGENYRVIMRWNRSTYFATSVGLLADKIAP